MALGEIDNSGFGFSGQWIVKEPLELWFVKCCEETKPKNLQMHTSSQMDGPFD